MAHYRFFCAAVPFLGVALLQSTVTWGDLVYTNHTMSAEALINGVGAGPVIQSTTNPFPAQLAATSNKNSGVGAVASSVGSVAAQ